jgi:hypothetical protein
MVVPLLILVALILIILIVLYSFKKPVVKDISANPVPTTTEKEVVVTQTVTPYAQAPIRSMDDYEYNLVFENEADRELTTEQQNKLRSQYPLDWSAQPPSSSHFQKGMKEMFENQAEIVVEPANNPYTAIVDSSMTPPDTLAMERAEREIIQTYQPKHAGDLTTYNVDDAMELIKKIYDKKDEIPQVVKKNDNVYEVIGTRKKNEKIVYDDGTDADATAPPPTVNVPQAPADLNTALDPFFDASSDTNKKGKWNYRQWTPGLERMFAPTESKVDWY